MQQFTGKYTDEIYGIISGLDRLVFRDAPRRVTFPCGMEERLWQNQIPFNDYPWA